MRMFGHALTHSCTAPPHRGLFLLDLVAELMFCYGDGMLIAGGTVLSFGQEN